MSVKLNANEVVLTAGDTNQVIDNYKIAGKLIVTNQRIYFRTLNEEPKSPIFHFILNLFPKSAFFYSYLSDCAGLILAALSMR
jgi:hypothetical protein